MVPSQCTWQPPVVFALVVVLIELHPVWIIQSHKHWFFATGCFRLALLVVDRSAVNWPCVLLCILVTLLVFKHVALDSFSELLGHSCLFAVFAEEEFSKSDSSGDVLLQTKLNQVLSIEGREARVSFRSF